jgi:hypothetical protein
MRDGISSYNRHKEVFVAHSKQGFTRTLVYGSWEPSDVFKIAQSSGLPIRAVKSQGYGRHEIVFDQPVSKEAVELVQHKVASIYSDISKQPTPPPLEEKKAKHGKKEKPPYIYRTRR